MLSPPPPSLALGNNLKTLRPKIHSSILMMKNRSPPSSYGSLYIPPHQRLRSVVTSSSYKSRDSVDTKLRESDAAVLNPRGLNANMPHSHAKVLHDQVSSSKLNSYVFAFDDGVSEDGSDRDVDNFWKSVRFFAM